MRFSGYLAVLLCALFSIAVNIAHASSVPVGRFRLELTSMKELRDRHLVRQRADFTCGSAALATILTYQYGIPVSEQTIIHSILASGKSLEEARADGFSLLDLKKFAAAHGLRSVGYSGTELAKLMRFNAPALVPVNIKGYRHFVIVKDVRDGQVFIANPALGNMRMPYKDFLAVWQSGIAFYVLPAHGNPPVNQLTATKQDYTYTLPWQTPVRNSLPEPVLLRHYSSDYILQRSTP